MKTKIEQQVMASVAAVYVGRRLLSRTALECYALFVCGFSVTLLVSLPHVVQNFFMIEKSGLPGVGAFFLSAMLNTSHMVQLIVVVGTGALLLMLADATRGLRSSSQPKLA